MHYLLNVWHWRNKRNRGSGFPCAHGLCDLGGSARKARRAATLLAAGKQLQEEAVDQRGLSPAIPLEYKWILARVRDQLDETNFNSAWAEGRGMTMEQGVAYALEESPKA